MANKQRIRETMKALPTLEYLVERVEAGWKLSAIEWERESAAAPISGNRPVVEEIPFGLRVSDDCSGLVESETERQIIITALDMIVEDRPLSHVAEELNRRGHTTREGKEWTPSALFTLLPRMIQIGPRVFTSDEWVTRKQRLPRVV
uniref:Recombinase domain-containing protein n=1 Tax=Solibacter usitatus (strain Ellin6076) TaxID=234267 RepID=Q02B81_SOLUE